MQTEKCKIVIFGATSAIAKETARIYSAQGAILHLIARDRDRLQTLSADLKVRGAERVGHTVLDMDELARHSQAIEEARKGLGGIDIALIAHGTLPDQEACQSDVALTLSELNTNAISTISLITLLANIMAEQRHGTIAVITSVAGDRGRRSNYVYGTAKAAVATFLQGIRSRLADAGVHVLTIKPGFVDTPMTAAFEKGILWATSEQVAHGIVRAIERKRDVAYLPWFWRYIMLVIKTIPERLFKRMSI